MSDLVVEVCRVDDVKVHPNADRLALAIVKGWQVVVGKDQFKPGELCVFFEPNTVLPDAEAERLGVSNYLSKGRVRSVRLRGEHSIGLVVPVEDAAWDAGLDVADHFGATKYVSPVKMVGDVAPEHPMLVRYTDVQNLRHFPAVFEHGEPVSVSEKIHGTNVRVAVVDGEYMAGSHRRQRKEPDDYATSTYWYPYSLKPVRNLLDNLRADYKQVILFGEVFGRRMQALEYGREGIDFVAFDLFTDGHYWDAGDFQTICDVCAVPTVPHLDTVDWDGGASISDVIKLASGKSRLGGDHIKEGVVLRAVKERHDPTIGRCVLKYASDAYLLKNYDDIAES